MVSLVGYTGFVGSNIYDKGQFDNVYNSKNIEMAYGTNPDILIYSGLRAEKYLANNDPDKDMEHVFQAFRNIEMINPTKLVLISTIDVFSNPVDVDEEAVIETKNLHPYGYNRYQLEKMVRNKYSNSLIIRLPGLFGKNIKKNFIYDYINVIPYMLKNEKFEELANEDPKLRDFYTLEDNGFYKVNDIDEDRATLKNMFKKLGFSALNFTDSRSVYQFYNLRRLWDDIQIALDAELKLWHPATEPVSASELYKYLTGNEFINEFSENPVKYDYKTCYSELFKGRGGYIASKQEIMEAIKEFVSKFS